MGAKVQGISLVAFLEVSKTQRGMSEASKAASTKSPKASTKTKAVSHAHLTLPTISSARSQCWARRGMGVKMQATSLVAFLELSTTQRVLAVASMANSSRPRPAGREASGVDLTRCRKLSMSSRLDVSSDLLGGFFNCNSA